ncbi:MAG TPA: class I SAM-dependent methyltransferase [Candidatus Omnitrophota bacterium]|nr:class I SAM-dependent methyltransferase [Candidatus Omnitrophota bacterium]HPN55383.1 class I SAM-dependent methyltransferase [Candidatus Omnitrophota bacterium]
MNSFFHRIYFFLKIGWLWGARKKVPDCDITDDYNQLAATYDEFFSGYMAPHALHLAQKIPLPPGPLKALDLACGTGTLTRAVGGRLGPGSSLTAVDLSEKMLEQAKKKSPWPGTFVAEDMMTFIRQAREASYNIVTAGWAIGYTHPQTLMKEIRRVLAPGGAVGIIENQQSTLWEIRNTGMKVMMRYPQHIRQIMSLMFRLPENKECLRRWFHNAGLKTMEIWDGRIEFRFKSGVDVLNWVLHTGASAGFDRMMDPGVKYLCDRAFIEIIEKDYMRDGQITTAHRFVAGVAQK